MNKKLYQTVIDYINKYLPFSDLINVKLHHMRRQGSIHIDMATKDTILEECIGFEWDKYK